MLTTAEAYSIATKSNPRINIVSRVQTELKIKPTFIYKMGWNQNIEWMYLPEFAPV